MFLYFSTGSVISFCFIVIKGLISGANAAIFEDFKLIDWRILGYFLIYALFSLAASFLYYSGYKLVGKSYSGGFNAITTCYVVIVFVIGYFYWDQKSFNLWLAIPGILLTVVGTILLSLAPF
jgi:drug/metabolite transporter (DMT)-like permease